MPENLLLLGLPGDIREAFEGEMETVALDLKADVMRRGEPITHIYFPETGLISVVVHLEDGGTVETLTIASEGFSGIPVLLGELIASRDAFVQIAGTFKRVPIAAFLSAVDTYPQLTSALFSYTSFALSVIEQSAACLAFHSVEARLARWLLSVHDRLPGDLSLTHEFLGQMLGVYRPTVTLAIGLLSEAGLISSHRGTIQILNSEGLQNAACECYAATRVKASP